MEAEYIPGQGHWKVGEHEVAVYTDNKGQSHLVCDCTEYQVSWRDWLFQESGAEWPSCTHTKDAISAAVLKRISE